MSLLQRTRDTGTRALKVESRLSRRKGDDDRQDDDADLDGPQFLQNSVGLSFGHDGSRKKLSA